MFEVIHEEMWFEILSWLPVKDLMRLRCVSKWWKSVTSHPTFVKFHLQKSIKNSYILLLSLGYWMKPYSVHALLDSPISTINASSHSFKYEKVMCVCNGLVLLVTFSYDRDDESWEYRFKIWNPATRRETQNLPTLYLDLSASDFAFGFGYDDWTDTYKLLVLFVDLETETMEVWVYCLGGDDDTCWKTIGGDDDTCWKTILTCPASFTVGSEGEGRFVSGTVNFLAFGMLGYDCMDEMFIVSYDMRKNTYRYLSMPHGLVEKPVCMTTLEILKGCLCVNHWGTSHFSVWLMREFGVDKSWNQLLRLRYEDLSFHGNLEDRPMPRILCMDESEDVMLLTDARRPTGEILRYKKRDNAIEVFIYDYDQMTYFMSFEYVQSLAWPLQN